VRSVRTLPTLDPVEVGDHVCWLVDPGDDFTGTARAFLSDGALLGDKVLVVDSPGTRWLRHGTARGLVVDIDTERTDGSWDAEAMLGVVRREADTANREGFRALRVLARMDRLWPDGATPAEVARHEMGLDALVAEGGALVLCAYHRRSFPRASLEQSVGVHPHTVGMRPVMPDFRMFSAEPNCWSVSGVVDSDGAAAFRTAVSGLLSQSTTVRLRCEDLELMDAAGMQALAEAAAAFPGRTVVVEGANETVRRCWTLLGYDAPQIPVELAP